MDMNVTYRFDTASDFVGKEVGVGDWIAVDQARIDQFAACTGDDQWIHVDADRASREGPFGGTIAHGFLTLSLLAAPLMNCGALPAGLSSVINAGVNNVRFRSPVRSGRSVRARFTLKAAEPKGEARKLLVVGCVLEIENESEPALTADITVMAFR